MATPKNRVEEMQLKLTPHIEEMAKNFKNPKITVIVRDDDEEDLILSDDDLYIVKKSVETLLSRLH